MGGLVNATVLGQNFKWMGCESYGGYHSLTALAVIGSNGSIVPTVPFAVLPTSPMCNGTMDSLTATMSHEMVEAATDPGLFGWYDSYVNDILATGLPIIEIGDFCETRALFPTPAKAFAGGKVSAYWSNTPAGCTFGALP